MLAGWIAAVIGIIIVVFSLNSLIREIRKAGIPNMEDQSFSDTFYELLNRTERLGENLDDINQTFYETIERLEKRIEILEKKAPAAESAKRFRPEPSADPVRPAPAPVSAPNTPPPSPAFPEEVYTAAKIRKLLNEGKDTPQIARELNLGVGEVELIRRLKPESQDSKAAPLKKPRSSG